MPRKLQIRMIKNTFKKLNPRELGDDIDFDVFDNKATYRENLEIFKTYHPQYRWDFPKKDKIRTSKQYSVKQVGKFTTYTFRVKIKEHRVKAKGKYYTSGRVQLTVDKELIGHVAEVKVFLPTKFAKK
jgi:hypothetical protein